MSDTPPEAPPADPVDPTVTPSSDSPTPGSDTGAASPAPEQSSPPPDTSDPATHVETDADGNPIEVDENGNVPTADEPPAAQPEQPSSVDTGEQSTEPGAIPGDTSVLLPTDGNWSPEQIAAAEAAGVNTPQGAPLSAAARETVRGLLTSIAGIRSWCDYAEKVIARVPR
jgi:hypothetical protein